MNLENQSSFLGQPCAICNESRPELFKLYFDGYVKLYQCLSCGFISQFPGPGRNTIITEYEDRYSLGFIDKGWEFMYPRRRASLQNIVERVTKVKKEGRILDVGCGDGHFLYLCAKKGLDCYGVEDSKQLAAYASNKTGAQIIQGQYNREMFPSGYFDVISFIQVLEHIPTPITALETAKYHLREGGLLVIEVPSIMAPHFLLYQITKNKRFVKPPTGVIESHFGYYSPNTLTTLTQKCGFNKMSLTTGHWQYKYTEFLKIIDPILDFLKIGGILYIGETEKSA